MFEISKELELLAKSIISEDKDFVQLRTDKCRIAFLYSDKAKTSNGKTVFADTTKINDKVKAIAGFDFIITFYSKACSGLDEQKMKILMKHELKHVGFKDGKCSIIPHDVEDFSDIIKNYGMNWTI